MKEKISIIAFLAFFIALLAAPSVSFASFAPLHENVFDVSTLKGPILVCTGTGGGTSGLPACNNLCDLVAQVANVIYFFIAVVIWIVTPILIAVGGIMYVLAGASPEMIGMAKKTLTGVVWGIVIVLCGWLIVSVFISLLGITGVAGFGSAICKVPS